MSFEVCFDDAWLDDVAESNPLVPQFMEVTIAGRAYVLDTSFEPYRRDAFRHRSIQSQRESISLDNITGEGTVNTEGLWRRLAEDWSKGAGQPYQDRKESIDARFSTSKGINPWMQWQASLLNDTKKVLDINGDAQVAQVGQFTYVLDVAAQTLKYSADLVNWTTPTFFWVGTLDTNLNSMATDGHNLWISDSNAQAGHSLWYTTAGTTIVQPYVTTGQLNGVWYVADRLMVAGLNNLYNIVTQGNPLPTALWTHPNPNFLFLSMCAGSSQIYIGGWVATGTTPLQSVVYRTTIEATGTALTIPVQALPMEGGEYVTSLYGYLNYVFVGSNLGVRMCRTIAAFDPTGNEGDLEAGPLIPGLFPPGPLKTPCYAMTGNNRFVYFGWNDYDAGSTGLGRCDLSSFIDTQAPAFASDLMVTGQGSITSMDWCTISDAPIFVVQDKGIYTASNTFVPSGYVTSGYIGYGIPDSKIVLAGNIGTVQPQQGTASLALAADYSSNVFAFIGAQGPQSATNATLPVNATRGDLFTVQVTLTRDPTTGQSPTMHRWMVKAIPAITAGTTVSVVLRMWDVVTVANQDYHFDPYAEKAFLENLRTTQTVFAYTEGPLTYPYCTIDEIDWLPEKRRDAQSEGGFQGNLIVYLKNYDLGA